MYMNPYQNTNKQFEWIMVPTTEQVEQIAVQPNQKAWIMVQNEPVFALRVADQMGLVTTEYYRFEKIEKKNPANNYVTKDELEELLNKLLGGKVNESNTKPARNAAGEKAKP